MSHHLVPCAACQTPISQQTTMCPRCGHPTARVAKLQTRNILVCVGMVAVCFLVVMRACSGCPGFSASADAEFCAKNRTYYESFCRDHASECKEGPAKLARCE